MISYEFLYTFLFKRPLRVAAIILSLVGTKEGKAYSQECFYILQKYYNSIKIIFQLLFVPSIFCAMASVSCDSYCTRCRHHYHSSKHREHSFDPTFVVDYDIKTEEEELKKAMKKVEDIAKNLLEKAKQPKAHQHTQLQDTVLSAYVRDYEEIHSQVHRLNEKIESKLSLRYRNKIRIASWNLHNNSKYTSSMCWTINNHDFDIVALQEVGEGGKVAKDVLDQLKKIDPTWTGKIHTQTKIAGAFLWREMGSFIGYATDFLPDNFNFRLKCNVGVFQIGKWNFALVNFHLAAQGDDPLKTYDDGTEDGKEVNKSEILRLYEVPEHVSGVHRLAKKNVILIGDFNTIPENVYLKDDNYKNIFDSSHPTNALETKTYDNIILHDSINYGDYDVAKTYKDATTIVRKQEAREISDHLPIWVDVTY